MEIPAMMSGLAEAIRLDGFVRRSRYASPASVV
jgi:hypothetical protein